MTASEIERQAALWLMRSEEADWSEADALALQKWLDISYAHKAAYWRLEYGWRAADRIGALGGKGNMNVAVQYDQSDVPDHMVQRASFFLSDNVIAFPQLRQRVNRRMLAGIGTFAVALSLVAIIALPDTMSWIGNGEKVAVQSTAAQIPPESAQALATAVGHRKLVRLLDGSEMELNTDTRIKTLIADAAREVWLEDGEVYFDIRHLQGRPFVVHAGSRRITVLGTKFAVLRNGDEVKVSVVDGRVRVEDLRPEAPIADSIITAGDTILAREGNVLVAKNEIARVERDLAWRDGFLAFDQTALSDVASDFNRYNGRKLYVADQAAAQIRIGGRFKANNVEAFVRLLRDAYGLKVEDEGENIKISS